MNIAELFVNLGVKGDDKSLNTFENVRKGLKGISSTSLQTKAAILGAIYAFERMFSKSSEMGTNLTNFNATLGVSAKTLQQYQYAARQVGVSNEAVESSFKGLQNTMTKTLMGEGAPKGLGRLAMLTGEINQQDILRFQQNPQELIQRLQKYAAVEQNAGMRNEVLKSFGIGDDMIAALSRQAFKPETLAKAPTYSDNEVKALDKANIAWSNLGNSVQMAFGRFNAKHGGELVNDISKIVDKVLQLSEAFMKLSETLKLFEWIGKVFEGWTLIFDGVTGAVNKMNEAGKDPKKADELKKGLMGFFTNDIPNVFKEFVRENIYDNTPPPANQKQQLYSKGKNGELIIAPPQTPGSAVPKTPAAAQVGSGNTQQINVNQTLQFQHDGKDAAKTGDSVKKAVQGAFRQLSAQGQGS